MFIGWMRNSIGKIQLVLKGGAKMRKLNLWKILCFALIFSAGATIGSPANTFTSLVSFNGTDGTEPFYGTLVQGLNGDLYGTTSYGGTHISGTVFEVTPAGNLTAIQSFDGGARGRYAQAGLYQYTNGIFYGTTVEGGTDSYGTIFQVTPAGTLTTLHRSPPQINSPSMVYCDHDHQGTVCRASPKAQ
jgi:uncharacterized repeat protein (TIGR03803 family)